MEEFKKVVNTSVEELSIVCENTLDFENKASIISLQNEVINKDNIINYTIINVLSSTICLVSVFLIETINLSFVGHTTDSEINLSAV